MSCYRVNSFDFSRGENGTSASARVQFFQHKIERINSSRTCFALITHLLSTQKTKSWKMLMNNEFKAQSLNRKSYRKFALSCFSVTCLNMSGYFDQSARSIESRCVVKWFPKSLFYRCQSITQTQFQDKVLFRIAMSDYLIFCCNTLKNSSWCWILTICCSTVPIKLMLCLLLYLCVWHTVWANYRNHLRSCREELGCQA